MTLPSIVRVFFAIDLPISVKEKLGKYIGSLKKRSKSNDVRWTKSENLHVTLHFLAEVKSEHLIDLIENVRKNIKSDFGIPPMTIGMPQLLPSPYRPRVIVLDIDPQEQLSQLASIIGQGIVASSYELEHRPFRAHLTIGRIVHAKHANLSFLSEFVAPEVEPISIKEVVLFRSEPQPVGSMYTVLERISILK